MVGLRFCTGTRDLMSKLGREVEVVVLDSNHWAGDCESFWD